MLVAVARDRKVRPIPGATVVRSVDFPERVQPRTAPPRIRVEHAAVEAIRHMRDPAAQLHLLVEVCRDRTTTPAQIAEALRQRRGIKGRSLLLELLADLETGACSVLEREWLRLERRHGLPTARRQAPTGGGVTPGLRDAVYEDQGVVVELDGRAHHGSARAWDRDHERDLEAATSSDLMTLRLSFGQVFGRGCLTVGQVAVVLRRRGWTGPFLTCPDCP